MAFTFSVRPNFLTHVQSGQEVGASTPDYCLARHEIRGWVVTAKRGG